VKKRILVFCIAIACVMFLAADAGLVTHIRTGSSLPANCTVSTGDIFFKTSSTIGLYQCTATNTWTAVGSGTGVSPAGSSGDIQTNDGAGGLSSVTQATFAKATGAGIPDPAYRWFAPSGVTVAAGVSGKPQGDVFIVTDPATGNFLMYYFRAEGGSPFARMFYRSASTLEGLTSATETENGSLQGYHKFVILVDENGAPVQIGGTYHGHASLYDGNIAHKVITHFTASSLTGTWTAGSVVIPKGSSGTWDGYNADTPYAIYSADTGTIRLWYMAAPDTSQVDFGYAEREMIATATLADGPFTKNYSTAVLSPTVAAAWDHGWIGGVQIRRRPDGTYLMLWGAGDTRPSSAGTEPDASNDGFAYSTSLDGPWTKDPNNPYTSLSNLPSNALEGTDIWRAHLAFDPAVNQWYMFYNTQLASTGGELITFARAGSYDYHFPSFSTVNSNGGGIQCLTTSNVAVPNSAVNLMPGTYKISASGNLMSDATSGTLNHLDVQFTAWVGGTGGTKVALRQNFIGNYAFENHDSKAEAILTVTSPTYVTWAVQVMAGTPASCSVSSLVATGGSQFRNLHVNVQRIN
jgi:hypothetical protein